MANVEPPIIQSHNNVPSPLASDEGLHSDTDTTATNSSDEFEEDGYKPAKEEQIKAKRGRALWLAFMKLTKWLRVLVVGCLVGGILVSPMLVVDLRFKHLDARPQVHFWSLWLSITWAASCVIYLVVDSIPYIILSTMIVFGAQVQRLKIQIELVMAVSGWLKLTLDVSAAWISLSITQTIYHPPGSYWVIVNRVMQALFAASIILLAEKLFLNFVAINFHQKALAERLKENRLALKVLDRLSNAHPANGRKLPQPQKRSHRPYTFINTFNIAQHSHKHSSSNADEGTEHVPQPSNGSEHQRRRPAKRMPRKRRKMATVIVDQVGGAIGAFALKDSRFQREGGVMGGLYSAKRLARKLFDALNVIDPDRTHLLVEDFYPYFRTTAEAQEAFSLFDKDRNGDISKQEMREAVQRIYRERKALVSGLKDVDSIVAKLDGVLLAVAFAGIIFVCLLIFNRNDTVASLVPLATIILGFSFIFGHSAQLLFESLIFIFSTHVFDVGDLVMIDDQALFVREFGLLSTVFRRTDGQEIIAPNSLLASTKLVHNLRRSKSMWESTTIVISYDTPLEVIDLLKSKLYDYVTANNREWSGFALNIDKMEYQNALNLTVSMEHRPNWQDWGGRWLRRNAFMRNLKTVLEELDITYMKPIQPVLLPNDPSGPVR